nr:hypothetical protein BgiMline_024794 [Biomphalaria glabrata]
MASSTILHPHTLTSKPHSLLLLLPYLRAFFHPPAATPHLSHNTRYLTTSSAHPNPREAPTLSIITRQGHHMCFSTSPMKASVVPDRWLPAVTSHC